MTEDRHIEMPSSSEALQLSIDIQPMLKGRDPKVLGGVLADLVSIWLAGFPAEHRQKIYEHWRKYMWMLIPASEEQLAGEAEDKKIGN